MVQSKILLKFVDIKHYFFDKQDSTSLEDYQIKSENCVTIEQIHGSRIILVADNRHKYFKGYDGMITTKQIYLAIRTADCLPIFFLDPRKKVIAAIHAGWKGLLSRIVSNTVSEMLKLGSKPGSIIAAVGPHIKSCCYNVSYQRILKFKEKIKRVDVAEQRGRAWYLDLGKFARYEMQSLGMLNKNIEVIPVCTFCDSRFYSSRREGSSCGRMLNVIGMI